MQGRDPPSINKKEDLCAWRWTLYWEREGLVRDRHLVASKAIAEGPQ